MNFATNPLRPSPVALLLTEPVLRRLSGGLSPLVGPGRDFRALDPDREPATVARELSALQPAGIIMEFREELTELVSSLGHPVVVVLADLLLEGMGCVNVDDHAVGRLAAGYLWDKGLRRFGFCGIEQVHAPERRTGFIEYLQAKGVEVSVREVQGGEAPRARAVRLDAWLAALPRPAGVFAAHDPLAVEVLEACRRLGLQVPAEVAVLAASNDPHTCELVHPGLSSVEIPWRQVGAQAARLLDRLLAGEAPEDPVLVAPGGIHTRGSTDFLRVSDERLQRAVAVMRANLDQSLGIDAVARAAGMDRRALERLFRAQLDRSPKQVLTDMRVSRACELLEQGGLRVGEIAERCGFPDTSRLAAAFRQRFGRTPGQWRKR